MFPAGTGVTPAPASPEQTRAPEEMTTTRPIAHRPSSVSARSTSGKRRNDATVALARTSDAGRLPKRRNTLFRIIGGHRAINRLPLFRIVGMKRGSLHHHQRLDAVPKWIASARRR